jgi:O-antigen ligase
MPKKNGQVMLGSIVFFLFSALAIYLIISKLSLDLRSLILVIAPIVFIITFINTDFGLIILIFSMLLSPELKIAQVPTRAVVMRIDDILLLVVFFTWLAKTAINKQLGLLKRTSLNRTIVAYILVCILSTGIGIAFGKVNPLKSFFYLLKYAEYFMLYFLVTNNLRDKKQIKIFVAALLITCALTSSYGLLTMGNAGGRATAPFEGSEGSEPNTLGGYLVFLFAIVAGFFIYSPSPLWQCGYGALAGFIFLTLLHTLSRGSYLAFIFMFVALILLTKKKKLLLLAILILGIFIIPHLVPMKVTNRVKETFLPGKVYKPLGARVVLDESASARVESWKSVLDKWRKRPILGYGVSGVGIIDTQYPLVLGETGIVGFWIFIWLMILIFRASLRFYRTAQDDWERGLALGFLAGFIGLQMHGFSAATFIIVRIMEPFWFVAAIVMMLLELREAPLQPA